MISRGVVTLAGDMGTYRGVIETGKFKVENVPAGTYDVVVTGVMDSLPQDPGVPDENIAEEDAADGDGTDYMDGGAEPKSLIHSKYSSPAESGLSFAVPSDSYELKLDPPE